MNPILPTPSQAAVVLKKFLADKEIVVPLSLCQEAVARLNGHASWNALTAHQPARKSTPLPAPAATVDSPAKGCHWCNSPILGDYCTNEDCCYNIWPQYVERDDIKTFTDEELEEMYHIKERTSPDETEVQRTDKFGNVIPRS